ncbi:MAG: glycosyltransferase family 4 protein, partial [Epsilonproteobacteria bacterium]|nr:glycosyltransferase family 4 protein [Campylobacterota bacterium]
MDKKIVELCLSPDLGGLEIFMVKCRDFFGQKTACKMVIAPQTKIDNYVQNEKYYIKRNKFFPLLSALKLARFIDKEGVDVVHFHWTRDIITVVLAKILSRKKPKLIQTRNMTMTRFKDDFYHKWLYKNIDMIHAVTYGVKEQLERFIPKEVRPKIVTVYMGTKERNVSQQKIEELQRKYNITQEDFTVGIIGRIEEGKGQWMVIESLAKLANPAIKALIVGHTMDAGYLQGLKKRVQELGLEERVIFTGFTKEVDAHIRLCDVTVLATPRETFGLVVIESMINKIPVIATNKGGPLEIITDKKDGLLFERNVEDLSRKIQMVFEDHELLSHLSHNAYQTAKERFDEDVQLQ